MLVVPTLANPKQEPDLSSSWLLDYGLGSRRGDLFPLLGEGIFTQDGHAWKHSREISRRQCARIQYQDLKSFKEHVDRLVVSLSQSEDVIDLQPLLFRFTLATTIGLIFGESLESSEHRDMDTFESNFDYASLICAVRLRLADFHLLYTPWRVLKACGTVKRCVNRFVEQALKDKEENGWEAAYARHAFVLDLYKELKDRTLVCDQLVNVLVAGRDTTACLMTWAL